MLIGLCGPEGAGKSTAAKLIAGTYRLPVWPFAGPLKRMIEALGVDPRHLYGTPADKAEPLALFGGQTARHAMQTLGTEWGRQCIGSDFWVRAWLATVPAGGAIADDVRFPNEAEAVLNAGGVMVRVIRSPRDLLKSPRHPSEDFARLPYTFEVVNDKCPSILLDRLARGLADFQGAASRVPVAALRS